MSGYNSLRAGGLDRWITIRRKAETFDEFGGVVETWRTIGEYRAELVTETRGDTATNLTVSEGGAISTVVRNCTFRTRWLHNLTISDAIFYDGREFVIMELSEIPRRRGWQIRAQSRGL